VTVYRVYVAITEFFLALTLWCVIRLAQPGALGEDFTMFALAWICTGWMLWRSYKEHRRLEAAETGGERR